MADPKLDGSSIDDTDHLSDLVTRTHVHDLVVAFYREIVFDDLLAPVFDEVAEVDWATHIPRLIDYWCRILFDEPTYNGSLLAAHQHVHRREAFRSEHFDRWYQLWEESVDKSWRGPTAERAKAHAAMTAGVLSRRLRNEDWTPCPYVGEAREHARLLVTDDDLS